MQNPLNPEDRRAVDLVLDRAVKARAHGGSFAMPTNGNLAGHVMAVEKVLNLLAMMPAEEPPADLVARTMARIDREIGGLPVEVREQPFITDNRPHA